MVPEIKLAWIEQLESGNIPQTQGKLGTMDGARCCLGVLCDIAVKNNIIDYPRVLTYSLCYDDETGYPSDTILRWAGILGDSAQVIGKLAMLNDEGRTFSQIAQIIREVL